MSSETLDKKTQKGKEHQISASEESILVVEIIDVPKIVCTVHFQRLALVGHFAARGTGVHHQLVDPSHHVLLELLHRPPKLLQLAQPELLDGRLPPALPPVRPPHLVQRLPALPLRLQLVEDPRQYRVEVAQVRVPVGLDEPALARVGRRPGVLGEEPVDNVLDLRVTEGEDLAGGGEDDDPYVDAAEGAELARFLEKPGPPFREGHLEVVFLGDFRDGDLLATQARFLGHGGMTRMKQRQSREDTEGREKTILLEVTGREFI